MYYWLGKLAAVLRVARPQHCKHDVQKAAEFKFTLRERLHALNLPQGRPVKIWVQDEGRFGLLSFTRRVWTLRGIKPVVPVHQRYQWCYVFAALECTQGELQAAYWDSVDLDITHCFLQQLTASDPQAEHVIIYDGAGFHPKAGLHTLPEHMHVITLPAYSPELNPVEGLWDRLRDEVCNKVYHTLDELQEQLTPALRTYWSESSKALSMVHGWIRRTANASSQSILPVFN
jgi:transposase